MKENIGELFAMESEKLELTTLQLYVDSTSRAYSAGPAKDTAALFEKAKQRILDSFDANQAKLRQSVCVEWDFCKAVNSDRLKMAQYIIDSGILAILQVPVPAAHLTVYLLRFGYFDQLCTCAKLGD